MGLPKRKYSQRSGFVLLETIIASSLLASGLGFGMGLEILMQRQEQYRVALIQQARHQYEKRRLDRGDVQMVVG